MWTSFQPNWDVYIQHQFGYPCPRGGGQAVQAGLSCPPPRICVRQCNQVNSYCTIILENLVVRDINIISVKLRCLHPTFSLVTLVWGVGGRLSRLVYLAPHQGFGSNSVISSFLLHHNLGIFSFNYSWTLFQPNWDVYIQHQFGYPCPRGRGKLSRLVYLAPPPPQPRIWVKQCHQLILIVP